MRLLVLGPGHPFRGGIARTTTELVGALRARSHRVPFLTPRRQYPPFLYPGAADRDPDACPRLADSHRVLDPLGPRAWPEARRRALAEGAEAWIIPYWTWAWAPLWSFLLRTRRRPPVLAVVHNPSDHGARLPQRLAARRTLSRCQGLFTHAASLAALLSASYPGVPTAFHPIPPPTVPALPDKAASRRALGLPVQGRLALFLGLIRPYKGVDVLLDALARMSDGDWSLAVAGEPWGGQEGVLTRRAKALGLQGRVRFHLRWVPEGEVPTWLGAADVMVLPYRSGSQSAVAPMALGSGVPVVASAVGGVPEVVEDGVNGLLVTPGSSADLAAALDRLDGTTLEQLAAGARRWAARVTWDAYAGEVERLVRRAVEGDGRPGGASS